MFHCLGDQAAALLNSLRISALNDSVDRGSGSPLPTHAAKSFVRAEQQSTIGRDFGSQSESSPSDQRPNRNPSDSLIKQDGHEHRAKTPIWRKPDTFIQSSSRAGEQGDDPFVAVRAQFAHPPAISECSPSYLKRKKLMLSRRRRTFPTPSR